MLDVSTLYLILAMVTFVLVAVVLIHHHNCTNAIRKKNNEVESITQHLEPRIEILEKEVIDIKIELDAIQEEIDAIKA